MVEQDIGVATRRTAVEALVRIERDDAFANLALGPILERSKLDQRDRRLVTELVYGTIRRWRACGYLVDRFLSSRPPVEARAALHLGAYQLQFTEIADHAAVSTTVSGTPQRYRGLVNAVLRKVAATPVVWPDVATELSFPDWIVDMMINEHGEVDGLAALGSMNEPPDVNMREDGYTQDLASQWVGELVDAQRGDVIADVCAAPGGKATAMAASGARVVALDKRMTRAATMARNVERLGADTMTIAVGDGTVPPLRAGMFDKVLVDAPCSGLGVLRRRPDARWRARPEGILELALIQRDLLDAAVDLVKPGGTLIYSVCTTTRAETIEQFEGVAERHPRLRPISIDDGRWRPHGDGVLLLPQDADTDGMSMAMWQIPSTS